MRKLILTLGFQSCVSLIQIFASQNSSINKCNLNKRLVIVGNRAAALRQMGNNPLTTDYTDVLQFMGQEEGRIRKKTDGTFVYDYFIKDHLGNTRMVLPS